MLRSVLAFWIYLCGTILNVSIAQQPKLILPVGHTDMVSSASFSPDGKYVVTASMDGIVKIWNALNGKLVVDNIKGHTADVICAFFSPDGKYIVTASADKTAKVWNAKSGELIVTMNRHTERLRSASFSPDGKYIVTTSIDKTAKLWNAFSGELAANLNRHTERVNSASFSPDGKYIVTSSDDKTARVWNAKSGKLLYTLEGHKAGVIKASFSPVCTDDPTGGKYILTASADKTAKVWNANNGEIVANLAGHTDRINSASFSPDGKYIVTGSSDKSAKVWNVTSGQLTATMKADKEPIDDIFYSPGEKNSISDSDSNNANDWNAVHGQLTSTLEGHTHEVISAAFSPDSKYVVTASYDDTTRVWNAFSGELVVKRKGHNPSYSPNGKYILTVFFDYSTSIWNALSGMQMVIIQGHTDQVISALFSPNGKYIVSGSEDKTAKVWNAANGQLVFNLRNSRASFSPDGKSILSISPGGILRVWDVVSGQLIASQQKFTKEIDNASFSPDGKYIVTVYADSIARVWNYITSQLIATLAGHTGPITSASFSPEGKYIVTASGDKSARLWNALNGDLIATMTGHNASVNSASFSPVSSNDPGGGKYIATTSLLDDSTKVWNAVNGKLVSNLKGTGASFSPDGKHILTSSFDDKTRVWNAVSGELVFPLTGSHAIFSPDGKYILTTSYDETSVKNELIYNEEKQYDTVRLTLWNRDNGLPLNTVRFTSGYLGDIDFKNQEIIWLNNSEISIAELRSGKMLYSIIPLDSSDYFIQLSSGYFQSTTNASKLLHYVKNDLKVISFEQLDVKYNRPDLVLGAIGKTDTTVINTYRSAYFKRIKKLGVDTTSFRDGYSVPDADFVNRDEISFEQKDEILSLHLKGEDSTYNLDRYNVWVNEVPVYGQRGINIRKNNVKRLDKTVSVILSQGENRIETSVTNVNGTESYRIPLTINYTPASAQKEKTHFIGIGIDQFKDTSYNLNYSVKDIRDLSGKLTKLYGNDILIDTLFNENVTVSNVKALKQKLLNTTVNDRVLISYSGHGLLSKDYDYFLSTYSVNFKNPAEDGLAYDELENLLDSIPARKKLMLIDACHSGEVDKEEYQLVKINQTKLAANHVVLKGGEISESEEGTQKLGLKNSFELMQNLFVNVGKSTGATIISAAAGTEFALENGNLKNGVFTYCIMEAMDKYQTMKVSELKKIVGARVQELTNGMQKPTSRNEVIAVDWNVW